MGHIGDHKSPVAAHGRLERRGQGVPTDEPLQSLSHIQPLPAVRHVDLHRIVLKGCQELIILIRNAIDRKLNRLSDAVLVSEDGSQGPLRVSGKGNGRNQQSHEQKDCDKFFYFRFHDFTSYKMLSPTILVPISGPQKRAGGSGCQ